MQRCCAQHGQMNQTRRKAMGRHTLQDEGVDPRTPGSAHLIQIHGSFPSVNQTRACHRAQLPGCLGRKGKTRERLRIWSATRRMCGVQIRSRVLRFNPAINSRLTTQHSPRSINIRSITNDPRSTGLPLLELRPNVHVKLSNKEMWTKQ